jgi:hypothetical protein
MGIRRYVNLHEKMVSVVWALDQFFPWPETVVNSRVRNGFILNLHARLDSIRDDSFHRRQGWSIPIKVIIIDCWR